MDKIQKTIELFIEKYKPKEPYLVAFSGGADSLCLLHALKQITDKKIIALHLNHNWRGEESDREEANCKEFCSSQNIEFYSEKLPDNTSKNETSARDERYKFFEKCAKRYNSDTIFTAHNANDNAETLIYRICHGTGVNGLQGICEKREIFYRPILNINREDIEKYCFKNNLTPNIDSSNFDTIHKRNLIRHDILPVLEKINPKIIDNINSLSSIAKEETEIIKNYVNTILNEICEDKKFQTKEFLKLTFPVQKRILYEIITPFVQGDYDQERILTLLEFIHSNKNSKSGKKCSVTNNLWIYVNETYFEFISDKKSGDIHISITKEGIYEGENFTFKIEKSDKCPNKLPANNDTTIFVNLEGIDFNFELRTRKNGDIIKPLGLDGTQKLKKYFNSKKIPNHEKDNIILLTQGDEVFWAAGYGISDRIKVKNYPTHKITLSKKEKACEY